MSKVKRKILRLVIGILVLLFLLPIGFLFYLYVAGNLIERRAEKKWSDEVKRIEMDGLSFRDLNKNGMLDPYEDYRQPVEARVEDLLSQMTLEEKAGMMQHPFLIKPPSMGGFLVETGFRYFQSPLDILVHKGINHITSQFGTKVPSAHAKWQNELQRIAERTRLGIPISVSSDPRHSNKAGAAVRMDGFSKWPDPLGFAAIGDSSLVVQFGRIAATEYRAIGIHTALHPMADLVTEPRWARINGTFGSNAQMSAKLTAAYVNGFQGDSISSKSVSCMTKHFSGGGPQKDGLDAHFKYGKEQAYPGDNFDYHLIPFKAAIAANTLQMMPYYGIPVGQTGEDVGFAFNKEIITDLLKDELGFEGIVCTDWQIISDVKIFGFEVFAARDHGVTHLPDVQKVKKAIEAGVDQFGGESEPKYIIELVRDGEIPEERIDRSVRKLLKQKFVLGLFDDPFVDEASANEICGSAEFVQAGKEAMLKSSVLLTNTIMDTRARLPLGPGLDIYLENFDSLATAGYANVVSTLEEADLAILGLKTPYDPGKNFLESIFHQGSLAFSADSVAQIVKTLKTKPTIVCIYLERAAVIPEIAEHAAALIGHFGSSDEALLQILFGDAQPSGKLPFELPSSMEAVEKQKEDVPDDSENPLFPYGYGLRYE